MLLLDGTLGADISPLLIRLQEEASLPSAITPYEDWTTHIECSHHDQKHPEGIIYLRVLPEIAFARIKKRALQAESDITLDYIKQIYAEKEQIFIENKNSPKGLEHLPVLVLNGNIDFQTDFAQFYNHLFYIRRFIKQIQDKKDLALGIYKEKTNHRHCC